MTRLQISENFGNTSLQTHARPQSNTITAPQAAPSAWQGLAQAFASGELLADTLKKTQQDADRDRASAYANSMSVSELGKKIKAGEMLASESPVFAATLQHIWGQNTHDAMEREVLSKVTTGELKFTQPAELDTYLTEARNTHLSGASEYSVAGFDKGYAALRTKLMDSVSKVNDREVVENASNQASDYLANTLLKVTGKDFKGTPQDAATALLDSYHLMRHTKVMPDAAAKSALQEVTQRAAAGGQKGVLEALLNSELPDVGSVRAFLGETKAQTFLATAGAKYDQKERQRVDEEVLPHMLASDTGSLNVEKFMGWAQSADNKDFLSASTVHSILNRNMGALAHQQQALEKASFRGQSEASVYQAQKQVDAALSDGRLWQVQGTNTPKVFTPTGQVSDFNVKDYAETSLKQKTAGLPFGQQVSAWALNGLENPDWKTQLQAGLLNLSSIGLNSTGKPTGELNDAGRRSIELFKELDAVNPDAAKQTAGDHAYKRFSDISFLMHLGRDASDAASIATNSAAGAAFGTPADRLEKKIAVEVGKLFDTPWLQWLANKGNHAGDFLNNVNPYTLGRAFAGGVVAEVAGPGSVPNWLTVDRVGNAHHNTVPNTSQVHGWVKRYATLLAHSGQVGDPEQALKLAAEYIANPAVSVQVNGTLYLRSELPQAPASKTPAEWLERFIDAGPKARARELGFAGEAVRLEYDEGARVYRAFAGGLPLTTAEGGLMAWQKGAIQQWYASQHQVDVIQAAARGATQQQTHQHKAFQKRINDEIGQLQKEDSYVMERYDPAFNKPVLNAQILSQEAFQRITRDGHEDKPLSELMKLYPSTKRKQANK
jgi:hypothetical protein